MECPITKEQRHNIYVKAREQYYHEEVLEHKFQVGICYYLQGVLEWECGICCSYSELKKYFPEIYLCKPLHGYLDKRGGHRLFWWIRTNYKKRLYCFDRAIKDTE